MVGDGPGHARAARRPRPVPVERHDCRRPRRRRPTPSTRSSRPTAGRTSSAIADVLTIDQETLDLLVQGRPGRRASPSPRCPTPSASTRPTSSRSSTRSWSSINKLKPDAIILYVNPIAFPALYKGLRGSQRDGAHPRRHGLRPPGHLRHGPAGGRRLLRAGFRRSSSTRPALPDNWPHQGRCSSTSSSATRPSTTQPPDFFAADGADLVDRPRRGHEAGRRPG